MIEDLKLDTKELHNKFTSFQVNGETKFHATIDLIRAVKTEIDGTQTSINDVANREQSRYVGQTNTNSKLSSGVQSAQSTANMAVQSVVDLATSTAKSVAELSTGVTNLINADEKTFSVINNLVEFSKTLDEDELVASLTTSFESMNKTLTDAVKTLVEANVALTERVASLEASQITVSTVDGYASTVLNTQIAVTTKDGVFYAQSAKLV